MSDQGQGHLMSSNFFPIYHNTNCQVGPITQLWYKLVSLY